MSIFTHIGEALGSLGDEKYALSQRKIISELGADRFLGVRTPALRSLAKELRKREDTGDFLSALPHESFEENQLHAFIIADEKDFSRCLALTESFLPYIDNWATCDQFSPKVFAKHREELLPCIRRWTASDRTYTVRFGICMLMKHFLGEHFRREYADMAANIRSEEYYINMARAWYFATALASNYAEILPYIEEKCLDVWTHNKTIQKAVESFRITAEQKQYLRTLKIKGE
ncbi:MAG: DNA alkylation repair protein [Ruminococcus sp.]|nr:DNA alkylation repair protein [Ruminococcus sp.]